MRAVLDKMVIGKTILKLKTEINSFIRSKLNNGNILNSIKFKLLIPQTRNNHNEILGTLITKELGFLTDTFE